MRERERESAENCSEQKRTLRHSFQEHSLQTNLTNSIEQLEPFHISFLCSSFLHAISTLLLLPSSISLLSSPSASSLPPCFLVPAASLFSSSYSHPAYLFLPALLCYLSSTNRGRSLLHPLVYWHENSSYLWGSWWSALVELPRQQENGGSSRF